MDNTFKTSLWKQFGASIDMLENAIAMAITLLQPIHDNAKVVTTSAFYLMAILTNSAEEV